MSIWTKWRNPIAIFAVTAMLAVAAYGSLAAAGDINEAADAQVSIGALSSAASDLELAWFQAMGADALAATGEAPAEAQGFYDGAINLYNSSKLVLAAAGIEQIDQALAGSDQGLDAMNAAFAETTRLAATGDVAAATSNHMDNTLVLYDNVAPAVEGLGLVAQTADARLEAKMNSGASSLRLLGWLSVAVVALGAIFAGWTAWSIYRRDDEAEMASSSDTMEQPESMERAA